MAVANPIRVLLDMGASSAVSDVSVALDHFLIAGRVSMASVLAARNRHRQSGRRGLGALDIVLRDQRFGDKPPDSVLELVFARLIRRFELPEPIFHHRLRIAGHMVEPDFCFPDHRVIVEVDGWAYHAGRKESESDKARDIEFAADGWLTVRPTWLTVVRRPSWLVARLQRTLWQRAV